MPHKWVDCVHNLCCLGGPHRFSTGNNIIIGPRRIGYVTSPIWGFPTLLAAPPRPPLLPPASAFPPLPPLHPPSRPSLVVCPFRFVAAFFLFGGFGGLGFTSSTSLLELTVVLQLEEEE